MEKDYKEYFHKILEVLGALEKDNKTFKSEFENVKSELKSINKKLDRIERRQQINTLSIQENQDKITDLELKIK